MKFKIGLLGSIPKGDDVRKKWTDWKKDYKRSLSELDNIEFQDGDTWKDETQPFLLFGHDAHMVKTSDILIVNAEKKIGKGIGVGTAQEIIIAKYFSRPVITILPKNTHHRRSNIIFDSTLLDDWISPFLLSTSDLVVEKIQDSLPWIKEYMKNPKDKKIKGIAVIDTAIAKYLEASNKK